MAQPARTPRYLMALPVLEALGKAPFVLLPPAAEVEANLMAIHDTPPEHLIGRLLAPIPTGTRVEWESRGGGKRKNKVGYVQAYIPAGQSAAALIQLRSSRGHADISQCDRYLIQTGKSYVLPRAHVVEEAIFANRKQNEKDAA